MYLHKCIARCTKNVIYWLWMCNIYGRIVAKSFYVLNICVTNIYDNVARSSWQYWSLRWIYSPRTICRDNVYIREYTSNGTFLISIIKKHIDINMHLKILFVECIYVYTRECILSNTCTAAPKMARIVDSNNGKAIMKRDREKRAAIKLIYIYINSLSRQ